VRAARPEYHRSQRRGGCLQAFLREKPETLMRTKRTAAVTGALLEKGKEKRALPSSIKQVRRNGLETSSLAVLAMPTK